MQYEVPLELENVPGAQLSQVEEEVASTAALDFPAAQSVQSLSASVSVRLWSRKVPAGQLAHGLVVVAASSASYLVPGLQLSHCVEPLALANVLFGQDLHCVLCI